MRRRRMFSHIHLTRKKENMDINLELWKNGPSPGQFYSFPGQKPQQYVQQDHMKRTLYPTTTGTSVLAIKFDGGVVMAADMLGSYGSLARFKNVSRLLKVNSSAVIGGGGDYADFQHLSETVKQKVIDEECMDDGFSYTPKAIFSWVTRVLYNRRSKFNPLWNTLIVGGMENDCPYLGYVDKLGVAFETDTAASGYGAYIGLPLMREAYEKNNRMTEAEAKKVLDRCLKVLFYRDARSWNKYEFAIITKDGVRIEGPLASQTNWDIADMVQGYE